MLVPNHALIKAKQGLARCLTLVPGTSAFVGPPRKILASTPRSASINSQLICRLLQPQQSVVRLPAVYADWSIAKLFDQMNSGVIKEQFVASLYSGRYWGRCSGYIIDSDDCLHHDLSPTFQDVSSDYFVSRHDGLNQPFLPRVEAISGTIAAVNTLFSSNFHHWLLDCVPRFGLLKNAGFDYGDIDYFIVTPPVRPWHLQVLEYLEIPHSKIIASSPRVHIRADHLIVPSFSEPSRQPHQFNYTPEGIDFVRSLILRSPTSIFSYPEKIIVSRERATSRRLLSPNSILPVLEREGYVKVLLEDLSLAEQAMIFFSAKKIIMPTGGGLANLAFCRPDTEVIELFSPAYMPTFSFVIASHLGFQYKALVGENLSGSMGHSDAGGAEDISISLEHLMSHI